MSDVEIQLFGALRECEPDGWLRLNVTAHDIASLRGVVVEHASRCWAPQACALVAHSAFASESAVLRDAQALPANGVLALLPPVSGG